MKYEKTEKLTPEENRVSMLRAHEGKKRKKRENVAYRIMRYQMNPTKEQWKEVKIALENCKVG